MARLAFLADEHVDYPYVAALRDAGYEVAAVGEGYEAGVPDESLLRRCRERGLVLVTNDRDFVRLGESCNHAGIVVYTERVASAGVFVRAIERIDGYFSPSSVRNSILWLREWT